MMQNPFTKHPSALGETYFQHFRVAAKVSAHLLFSSLMQLVHAIFPFISPPLKSDIKSTIEKLTLSLPEARANEKQA